MNKQETLKEAAKKYSEIFSLDGGHRSYAGQGFIDGAKWQAERMYSEEDLREVFNVARHIGQKNIAYEFDEWFDNKLLSDNYTNWKDLFQEFLKQRQ